MKVATYIVLFEDHTSRKFNTLESLVESLEDIDALNVTDYFSKRSNNHLTNRAYPYQALTSHGDLCLISLQ